MKSIISAVIISMSICGAAQAAAKKPVEKNWSQEPTSFMGINFKSNVSDSVPACTQAFAHLEQSICYMSPPMSGLFMFMGTPGLGLQYTNKLFAQVTDGEVEYFLMETKSSEFNELSRVLITKYGEPAQRAKSKVKTKAGAEFDNETLIWKGKLVSITLEKYGSDINTSTTTLTNNALVAKSAVESERKRNAAASKL